MIIKKTVYIAEDGIEFDSEDKAIEHSRNIKIATQIQHLIKNSIDEVLDWAPSDVGMWIANNSHKVAQIIINSNNEPIESIDGNIVTANENSETQELKIDTASFRKNSIP